MLKYIIIAAMATIQLHALAKYELHCDGRLIAVSRDSALAQVGTLERTNSNDGAVEKYLGIFGAVRGTPYCAAGTYWCYSVAADALGISKSAIPIPKTLLANAIYDYAVRFGEKSDYNAEIDDLIIWRKARSIHGHIERIIEVGEKGWVRTVAFNSSERINGKAREGVFLKRRNIYHPLSNLMVRGLVGVKELMP